MSADVATLARLAREGGRLGIDVEFMSEGRYVALLCLVQVAVPDSRARDGVRIDVLDPLGDGLDPGPLAEVLADPEVEVVLHAGRQDVAILRREWDTEVRNVFDTQVAAAFAGFGAQLGYGPLLQSALGISLTKSAGFTRWDARPLSEEQLRYAREDVENLLQLADRLQDRLTDSGRLTWAREECRALESAADRRDPDEAWRRLPRVNRLRGRERAVAATLAAWREQVAAEENRPLGWVLGDAPLLELARRRPADRTALEQVRGLPGRTAGRRWRELLEVIARGAASEPPALHQDRPPPGEPGDAPLVALAEALVRARTLEGGLAYELVATKADLGAIVAARRRGNDEPGVRTLRGWRRDLVGAELLELLEGRRALAVDDARGLEITPRER
ncbi:MAG TPA: HRDC domain-containing protein [Solirubrobacteraceae bacterium]|nr:HRDC domain-containing protein [Solirubrobacteraceae bacterium]